MIAPAGDNALDENFLAAWADCPNTAIKVTHEDGRTLDSSIFSYDDQTRSLMVADSAAVIGTYALAVELSVDGGTSFNLLHKF